MAVIKNTDIRAGNRRMVADIIRRNPGITQSQLPEKTGLSIQTINKILKELEEERVVRRGEALQSSGGRPPVALYINADCAYGVGVSSSYYAMTISVSNLCGEIIGEREIRLHDLYTPLETDSDAIRRRMDNTESYRQITDTVELAEHIRAFLRELRLPLPRVRSVTVEVPGSISGGIWRSDQSTIEIAPLEQALTQQIGIPTRIGRNEVLFGLAESWQMQLRHAVCLLLDYGVGGAIVLDGDVDDGRTGHSGNLGHMILHPNGRPCSCGRHGCFGMYTSAFAILSKQYPTLEALFAAVRAEEPEACRTLNTFVNDLALGIASLAAIVDRQIVLDGAIVPYLEPYLPHLRARVAAQTGPDFDAQVTLGVIRENVLSRSASLNWQRRFFTEEL